MLAGYFLKRRCTATCSDSTRRTISLVLCRPRAAPRCPSATGAESSPCLVARPDLVESLRAHPCGHFLERVGVSERRAEDVHEGKCRLASAETWILADPESIEGPAENTKGIGHQTGYTGERRRRDTRGQRAQRVDWAAHKTLVRKEPDVELSRAGFDGDRVWWVPLFKR